MIAHRNEAGELHRVDGGPAVEYPNGTKHYYKNGKLHRPNGLPAVISSTGTIQYWVDGKLDRPGGLPAVIYCTGVKEYYEDGKLHRIGKPVIEYPPGYQSRPDYYYYKGVLHNEKGPAVEYPNQCGYKEWRINGIQLTKKEFEEYLEKKRKLALKYWLKWIDWMMDPNTERGQRFAERHYQRYLKLYK